MKPEASTTASIAASNPRHNVENWILSGMSKDSIVWMLEAVYKLKPDQCDRLYSLVQGELGEPVSETTSGHPSAANDALS